MRGRYPPAGPGQADLPGLSLIPAPRRSSRAVALAALLFCLASPLRAQVSSEAYRDQFLYGRFGEVCTMCEVTVLCAAGAELPPADVPSPLQDFTLYHFQTRTFWSQIATIREWFIAMFDSEGLAADGHTRPVHVYSVQGGEWSGTEVIEARLQLEPAVISLGTRLIDRTSRGWVSADSGEVDGFCARLPLWDALAWIESREG